MIAQAWLPPLLSLLRKRSWPGRIEEIYCCSKVGLPLGRAKEQRLQLSWKAGQEEGAGGTDWWARAQAERLGSRQQQIRAPPFPPQATPLAQINSLEASLARERQFHISYVCMCAYTNLLGKMEKKGDGAIMTWDQTSTENSSVSTPLVDSLCNQMDGPHSMLQVPCLPSD